jgi:16S rRNA (cytosine1402-N4)-methyltransferase
MGDYHIPVLLSRVIEILEPGSGGSFLDATVGGAGHSRAILEAAPAGGRLYGLDQDSDALERAAGVLEKFGGAVVLMQGNFRSAAEIYKGIKVDGALLDLGVSSHQFDTATRGFSCDRDGPLDMRMDGRGGMTAARLLAEADEKELAGIIQRWGESSFNRRIAKAIVERRREKPLESTLELAELIRSAVPRLEERKSVVQVFQALRIAVNDELGALEDGLEQLFGMLNTGGRLVVIAYHSLEDRIVKRYFARLTTGCTCPPGLPFCACGNKPQAEQITRKPVRPDADEIERNPRSRSALLRAVRKL